MTVTVDTNVLVRAIMRDDQHQARLAAKLLKDADSVAVSLPCLCEFAWVLKRTYKLKPQDVTAAIATLLDTENVVLDRAAVEAGLASLEGGGDFADGVIAYEGDRLGGHTFASFDQKAVALLARQGRSAQLLV